MESKNLVPSFLTSWVAWRDLLTDPGHEPFNVLRKKLGVKLMPSRFEYMSRYSFECPLCKKGTETISNSQKYGEIFCLCATLAKTDKLLALHNRIRTRTERAYFDDIKYPEEMGERYKITMGNFIAEAKRFIKRPDYWIYVQGWYGTGKTHILRAINTAFYPIALYISAGSLEQTTHLFRETDELNRLIETMEKAPILILDDLGIEYGGPLVKSIIEKVVDTRYQRWEEYPVITATNKTKAQMPSNYLPRAIDRFSDQEVVQRHSISTGNKLVSYRDTKESRR